MDIPAEKLLMASFEGDSVRYLKVMFGSPSRIMRCVMIKALNTIVHVESRNRCVIVLKISATPASPALVACRMCSTYLDFGAASYETVNAHFDMIQGYIIVLCTLILVPPFTDFS